MGKQLIRFLPAGATDDETDDDLLFSKTLVECLTKAFLLIESSFVSALSWELKTGDGPVEWIEQGADCHSFSGNSTRLLIAMPPPPVFQQILLCALDREGEFGPSSGSSPGLGGHPPLQRQPGRQHRLHQRPNPRPVPGAGPWGRMDPCLPVGGPALPAIPRVAKPTVTRYPGTLGGFSTE